MNSIFTVTTAIGDNATVLSAAELRAAAGLASEDSSKDTVLTGLGIQADTAIARACGVASDGVHRPTLLSETCTETWRIDRSVDQLMTARGPVSAITSVTVDGTALETSEFEFDKATGTVWRLSSDTRVKWTYGKVVIVYVAGFSAAPPDLKLASSKLVGMLNNEQGADSNLKREKIDGVMEREWWVSATTDPLMAPETRELIASYRRFFL